METPSAIWVHCQTRAAKVEEVAVTEKIANPWNYFRLFHSGFLFLLMCYYYDVFHLSCLLRHSLLVCYAIYDIRRFTMNNAEINECNTVNVIKRGCVCFSSHFLGNPKDTRTCVAGVTPSIANGTSPQNSWNTKDLVFQIFSRRI